MGMQTELRERPCSNSMDSPSPAEPVDQPVTIITPARGWQAINFREIWRARELMYFLVWRNLKTRYKQTVLGGAWAILQPLAYMAVFTVVLGKVAEARGRSGSDLEPYWLFVFTGLIPWTFFANTLGLSSQSVVGGSNLITKIYFPRLIVPVTAAGVPLVDLLVSCGILLILMLVAGVMPGWTFVLVPLIVFGLAVAALGLGILLSALAVAYRDVSSVVPFMIQLWMFATPTIYFRDTEISRFIGPRWQPLLPLNPAYGFIINFRQAVLGHSLDLRSLAISSAVGLFLVVLGCFYFRRVERSFADII
jgi:lipopolysaccharide transport system permease protein